MRIKMQKLDAKDREILSILSRDGRIAMKALAAHIGLSRSATSQRVANLEKSGTIRGYRADIGEIDANIVRAILLITLKKTPALELLDVLAQEANVRRVSSLSGELDMLVELECSSIDNLNHIRDRIAANQTVKDLTTTVVLRRDIDRE